MGVFYFFLVFLEAEPLYTWPCPSARLSSFSLWRRHLMPSLNWHLTTEAPLASSSHLHTTSIALLRLFCTHSCIFSFPLTCSQRSAPPSHLLHPLTCSTDSSKKPMTGHSTSRALPVPCSGLPSYFATAYTTSFYKVVMAFWQCHSSSRIAWPAIPVVRL